MTPSNARRGVDSFQTLSRHRWVVQRTFAWLNRFRHLRIRYERRASFHRAFVVIAAAIIYWR